MSTISGSGFSLHRFNCFTFCACLLCSYMVAKASRENSGKGDGIEVIKNEPFEKDGSKGQYTFKVSYSIHPNLC